MTAAMKQYPVVEVEWIDSLRTGGWRDEETYKKAEPATCFSAGYLVRSDRKAVTLVLSRDPGNSNMNDSTTIPRSAIKKVTKLMRKQ